MKIKSKLILAASSLLVLSGVAAGTSTFAWFTANQSATISASTMTVDADIDELSITATSEDSGFTANDDATARTFEGDTTTKLTDVSGNGISFFKASTIDGVYTSSSTEMSSNLAPTSFTFAVTFTRTNTANDMAIFLSNESSITANHPGTDADVSLAHSARVAILDTAGSESLAYYAPNEATVAGLEKIITAANTEAVTPSATNLKLTNNVQNILAIDNFGTANWTDYNDADGVAAKSAGGGASTSTSAQIGYIGTIAYSETTLNVRIRVWLEGQDADCDNDAKGGAIDANFIFNGVSEVYEA